MVVALAEEIDERQNSECGRLHAQIFVIGSGTHYHQPETRMPGRKHRYTADRGGCASSGRRIIDTHEVTRLAGSVVVALRILSAVDADLRHRVLQRVLRKRCRVAIGFARENEHRASQPGSETSGEAHL